MDLLRGSGSDRRLKVTLMLAVVASVVGLAPIPAQASHCPIGTDITWDGDADDGQWSTGSNWSTNVLPTSFDDVCIDPDVDETEIDVTGAAVAASVAAQEPIEITTSGSLTLLGNSSFDAEGESFSLIVAGALDLQPGVNLTVTIDGAKMVVDGGVIDASGPSTINLTSSSTLEIGRAVAPATNTFNDLLQVNAFYTDWLGGNIALGDNTSFNINSSFFAQATVNASITDASTSVAPSLNLIPGTYFDSNGGSVSIEIATDNQGWIDVYGGSVQVASLDQLQSTAGGGCVTAPCLSGSYQITDGGSLLLADNVSTLLGTINLDDAGSSIAFDPGGGPTPAFAQLAVNDGTMYISNGATVSTAGQGSPSTFTNTGSLSVYGTGARFDFTGTGTATNSGTISASAGGVITFQGGDAANDALASTFTGQIYLYDVGTLLDVQGDGNFVNSGYVSVSGGADLETTGGGANYDGITNTSSGTIAVEDAGSTLDAQGDGSVTNSGTLSVYEGATMTAQGGDGSTDDPSLENTSTGTVLVEGSNTALTTVGTGDVTNDGSMTIRSGGRVETEGDFVVSGTTEIRSGGRLESDGHIYIEGGSIIGDGIVVAAFVDVSETVSVAIRSASSFDQIEVQGTVVFHPGAKLTITRGSTYVPAPGLGFPNVFKFTARKTPDGSPPSGTFTQVVSGFRGWAFSAKYTSTGVSVTAISRVSLKTSKARVPVGGKATLSGKVAGTGGCPKAVKVSLYRKIGTGKFTLLTSKKATSLGNFSFPVLIKKTALYEARIPSASSCLPARSKQVRVKAVR